MPNDVPDWTVQIQQSVTGEFQATDFLATGIAPLVTARFVGAVNGGPPAAAPSSGSWQAGDLAVDYKYGGTWVWTGSAWLATGAMTLVNQDMNGLTNASFQNLPGGFSALEFDFKLRTGVASTMFTVALTFNNDTGAGHYYSEQDYSVNAAPVWSTTTDQTKAELALWATGTTNADFGVGRLVIPGYAQVDALHNYFAVGSHYQDLRQNGGLWQPASAQAITRVDLVAVASAYVAGSRVILRGLP